MRVVCFANNTVGLEAVRHLRKTDEEIVLLVVHETTAQKRTREIIEAAGLDATRIITGSQLSTPRTVELIRSLKPDCGVSAFFGHILRKPIIDLFPRGIVNLHTSLLPYNRGSYPNVWSIVDQTPAGVTMHLVDEGVDTGDVIAQQTVEVLPTDTGLTLNMRLESAMIQLFQDNWEKFANGQLKPIPQNHDLATAHKSKDTASIDAIELNDTYVAGDLINRLRARTYPPHRGAYFEVDGKKYYLKLEIEEE